MPSRNADTSCSPVLNKISEHEPADEPPSDPARSGIDSHLFAILRKNYDIISVIADIDRTDSPSLTRSRIPTSQPPRDNSPFSLGRYPQKQSVGRRRASLAVPSLRFTESPGSYSDGHHTPLSSGDEYECPRRSRPGWDNLRDRLTTFYADIREALAETNEDAKTCRDVDSAKLSAQVLRRDIKLYESHVYLELLAGLREILVWKNPAASLAMLFVYMYCVCRGWLLSLALFLVLLQLMFNYLYSQRGVDLGLCLLPRQEIPMTRLELSGAQLVFDVARRAQVLLTSVADVLEKTKALFMWKRPDVTTKFFLMISTFFLLSAVLPNTACLTVVGLCAGVKAFITTYLFHRFPRLRNLFDVIFYFYSRLPTTTVSPQKSISRQSSTCSPKATAARSCDRERFTYDDGGWQKGVVQAGAQPAIRRRSVAYIPLISQSTTPEPLSIPGTPVSDHRPPALPVPQPSSARFDDDMADDATSAASESNYVMRISRSCVFVDKEKTSPVKRVASGTLTLSERMLTFRYCRPKDDMSGTLEIPFDDILTIKKVRSLRSFPLVAGTSKGLELRVSFKHKPIQFIGISKRDEFFDAVVETARMSDMEIALDTCSQDFTQS